MIDSLRGTLLSLNQESAVVEVGGVGYRVNMSGNSLSDLPKVGDDVFVLVHMSVREDAISLFGFSTESERALFLRLINVSGIGPKVALSALSTFPPDSLTDIIMRGDTAAVARIPGVGKKTAQRIVLELKGTLEAAQTSLDSSVPQKVTGLATEALLSMGLSPQEVELALQGYDGDDTEDAVRYALKRLGTKL